VLEKVVLEDMRTLSCPLNPFEACLISTYGYRIDSQPDEDKEAYANILDSAQPYLPRHPPREVLDGKFDSLMKMKTKLPRWN